MAIPVVHEVAQLELRLDRRRQPVLWHDGVAVPLNSVSVDRSDDGSPALVHMTISARFFRLSGN